MHRPGRSGGAKHAGQHDGEDISRSRPGTGLARKGLERRNGEHEEYVLSLGGDGNSNDSRI